MAAVPGGPTTAAVTPSRKKKIPSRPPLVDPHATLFHIFLHLHESQDPMLGETYRVSATQQ